MIINLKEKFIENLPEVIPEDFRTFLNSLNEENFIISISTNENQTNTEQTASIENDFVNEIHQMLDELYLQCIRIKNLSEEEKKNIQLVVNNSREYIIKIIHSFYDQILLLKNNIADLRKEMLVLQQEEASLKRSNIISELFSPLKKKIFQEMSKFNIPSCYYHVNILKSMLSSNIGDASSAVFYLNVHKMNNEFDEQTFDSFRNLLVSISSGQKINVEIFLTLLIEKEKRNFQQHSIITDFIKDSYRTNDARLTTLLRQQEILSGFELIEIEAMDTIYSTYFGHLFTHH